MAPLAAILAPARSGHMRGEEGRKKIYGSRLHLGSISLDQKIG